MNSKIFFEAMNEVDDKYYEEAINYKKKAKKPARLKWGAFAACLCLVAVGAVVLLQQRILIPGDISTAGGRDGSMYSIAVYPATEREENVDSAEVVSLTESEALDNPLAEYLPRQLPDGFHYGRGNIYNTIMKDGTQYNMLRVEYISGTIPELQFAEDGGEIVPDLDTMGESFLICVMNYEPETDINIYSSYEEVTVSILEESGAAYIQSGDCYIGVFIETAEPAVVLEVLRNIE